MRFLLLAVLFGASTALAQANGPATTGPSSQFAPYSPSPPVIVEDGPGNGVQLELGVLSAGGVFNFVGSVLSGVSSFGGSTSGLAGLLDIQPNLLVGYQWMQNAVLFGVDLNAIGGTGTSGTSLVFGIGPTYRRYFTPLRAGGFSPFGEGSIGLLLYSPSGEPISYGLALDGGLGGEWLFVKNFALFVKATVAYEHVSVVSNVGVPGLGGSTDSVNLDGIGLTGSIGLTAHL